MKTTQPSVVSQQGAALLEVLVTILLVAFGLLGLAGLISRSFLAEIEATQRSQALLVVQDMVGRIEANRRNASLYITASPVGGGSAPNCSSIAISSSAALVNRDLCEWGNLLRGANESLSSGGTTSQAPGLLSGAVGCVLANDLDTLGSETTGLAVAVSWQANNPTVAPDSAAFAPLGCGAGVIADERYRRVIVMPVNIGSLAVAP